MIASNDQLPDIEKLERQEFILDTEEHQRLQVEEDALIQQVGRMVASGLRIMSDNISKPN